MKPGQLDTQQVDAQIGSGFVQVRDVELENEVRALFLHAMDTQLIEETRPLTRSSPVCHFVCTMDPWAK